MLNAYNHAVSTIRNEIFNGLLLDEKKLYERIYNFADLTTTERLAIVEQARELITQLYCRDATNIVRYFDDGREYYMVERMDDEGKWENTLEVFYNWTSALAAADYIEECAT